MAEAVSPPRAPRLVRRMFIHASRSRSTRRTGRKSGGSSGRIRSMTKRATRPSGNCSSHWRCTATFIRRIPVLWSMTPSLYGRGACRSSAWCSSSSRWRSAAYAAALRRSDAQSGRLCNAVRDLASGCRQYSSTRGGGRSCSLMLRSMSKSPRTGGRATSLSCDMNGRLPLNSPSLYATELVDVKRAKALVGQEVERREARGAGPYVSRS